MSPFINEFTHDVEGIKLVAVIMSLVGIVWFVGGQHGFVLGGLLFFVGIGLFIV